MSEFSRKELIAFCEAYDKFSYAVKWKQGDICVMCNIRWAHGRPEFKLAEGKERQLGLIMGPQYHRVGQKDGCWPVQENDQVAEQVQSNGFLKAPTHRDLSVLADANVTPEPSDREVKPESNCRNDKDDFPTKLRNEVAAAQVTEEGRC